MDDDTEQQPLILTPLDFPMRRVDGDTMTQGDIDDLAYDMWEREQVRQTVAALMEADAILGIEHPVTTDEYMDWLLS